MARGIGACDTGVRGPLEKVGPRGTILIVKADPRGGEESFGDRLKMAMDRVGYGYNELAKDAGLGEGYVSRLVNGGRKQPRATTVERLARLLKVRQEWLTSGKGPIVDPMAATLGELPGWAAAVGAALALQPELDWAIHGASKLPAIRAPADGAASPTFVLLVAHLVAQTAGRAEQVELQREIHIQRMGKIQDKARSATLRLDKKE